MKKGMIIRRTTKSGTPVGAYWRITRGGSHYNDAEKICVKAPFKEMKQETTVISNDDHITVVPFAKTIVSEYLIERLEKDIQTIVIHDATRRWEELYHMKPELVQFSSIMTDKQFIFKVQKVEVVYYGHVRRIRLELGARIQ